MLLECWMGYNVTNKTCSTMIYENTVGCFTMLLKHFSHSTVQMSYAPFSYDFCIMESVQKHFKFQNITFPRKEKKFVHE